ncbi:MAG TPA: CBS domain-containing protein [Salinimicrobium sp.]|nr:CBS domain-containing protein [Salinimicrobium sp.]
MELEILNDIEIRRFDEKIGELQELFNQYTYSHLPVENENIFRGCISENDVHSFDPEKTVGEYQYALEGFFVRENENWLNMLAAFSQNQTNILPVLDEEHTYLGYIELKDIINLFTETPFLHNPGGILIVEKNYLDYSFSEISQILESNGAHVLGAFVSKIENDVAQIIIKTGQVSLNSVLQTFRRYGYRIVSHHQEDAFQINLKERSKYLDKYLNI